jgi:serine/threonine-protein kinase RsbW
MINSATWSDPVPVSNTIKRPPHADEHAGQPGTAVWAVAGLPRCSVSFPATASHIAEARRFVVGFAADPALAADAVLCLSEVATNAVIHSNSGKAGGRFTVSAERYGDGCVRIEVEDQGGRWTERTKPEGQQHLGLAIVSQLASAWGIEGDGAHRRTVWFELRPVSVAQPAAA